MPTGLPWAGKAGWLPKSNTGRRSCRDKWIPDFLCDKRAPPKCRSTANRLILDVRILSGCNRSHILWHRLFSRSVDVVTLNPLLYNFVRHLLNKLHEFLQFYYQFYARTPKLFFLLVKYSIFIFHTSGSFLSKSLTLNSKLIYFSWNCSASQRLLSVKTN